MNFEADAIWDAWCRAREADPLVEAVAFAAGYGQRAEAVLEELGLAMLLEELRPAPLPLGLRDSDELRFGPFQVRGEIGRGGFGIVFDAVDESGQRVAIKVVNPLLAVGGERQEALLEEARVLAELDHPGIVRLEGCGRERGFVWFAMEHVDGAPLDALPPLEFEARVERTVDLGLQLAHALEAAHNAKVVHRDLKPSNVLVTARGELRILDFGLALRDIVTVSVSHSGDGAGTPAFMAPEQLTPGGRVGPRTDLHGAGYLLLLLVRPELRGEMLTSHRLTRRRLGEQRGLPRACFRGLPADLGKIIRRCLEVHAVDRYAHARELAEDLAAFEHGEPLPHGRPGGLRRGLRWVGRHPARSALVLGAGLGLAQGYRLWVWDPLVSIRIESHLSGKTLWLDGSEIGLTPFTIPLRSGRYRWQLQYGGRDEPMYSGWLTVERGRPASHLFMLNPAETENWADPTPYDEVPAGAGAWIRIAARELDPGGPIELTGLPDQEPVEFEDYLNLRLPFGEHRLTLSAPEYRPKERVISIEDETMHVWSTELDKIDSPWSTVTVYGPLEEQSRQLVESQNLRTYLESERNLDTGEHTFIRYFGPLESAVQARVGFWVDLPGPVLALEVEASLKSHVNGHSSTWIRLELGPDPGSTIAVAGYHGEGVEQQPEVADLPADPRGTREEERLEELMQGSTRLFVRYVIGPTLAGDSYAYGGALRAERGPEGSLWKPAMRLRVRTQPDN